MTLHQKFLQMFFVELYLPKNYREMKKIQFNFYIETFIITYYAFNSVLSFPKIIMVKIKKTFYLNAKKELF